MNAADDDAIRWCVAPPLFTARTIVGCSSSLGRWLRRELAWAYPSLTPLASVQGWGPQTTARDQLLEGDWITPVDIARKLHDGKTS